MALDHMRIENRNNTLSIIEVEGIKG